MGADEPSLGEYIEICERSRQRRPKDQDLIYGIPARAYFNMTAKEQKKQREKSKIKDLRCFI